jgi:hypothetical protein
MAPASAGGEFGRRTAAIWDTPSRLVPPTVGMPYYWSMNVTVVHAHLPRELADRLDVAAAAELRSRSNMLAVLAAEGLRRRETAERQEAR